jgi:hypothetical protein
MMVQDIGDFKIRSLSFRRDAFQACFDVLRNKKYYPNHFSKN